MDQAQHCRKANNVRATRFVKHNYGFGLVSQRNKLEERRHQPRLILYNHATNLISNFLPSTPITTLTMNSMNKINLTSYILIFSFNDPTLEQNIVYSTVNP